MTKKKNWGKIHLMRGFSGAHVTYADMEGLITYTAAQHHHLIFGNHLFCPSSYTVNGFIMSNTHD